jgi:hypothetical protein
MLAPTYNFTGPTCTITITTLETCALILSFSFSYPDLIKFPYFADLIQRGDRGWKEAQRQGDITENSISIQTLRPIGYSHYVWALLQCPKVRALLE